MKHRPKIKYEVRAALRIATIYLVFSVIWILFSDQVVLWFFRDIEGITTVQTMKGWAFILITSALIFFLLEKEISRHLLTRKSLKDSEQNYRMLVDNTPDLIYRTDIDGVITFVSGAVYRISGYTVEESLGMKMAQEVYAEPEERDEFLKQLTLSGKVKNFEARLKRKDGSIWWASTNAHFYKDENDQILGVEGVTRDITEKKEAEEALQASERRLRAMLEANPDPMVLYDLKGHPQYLNPAFTTVFGWTFEEVKNRKIPFVPESEKQRTADNIKKIFENGKPLAFETRRYTKTGEILDIILSAAVSKDREGSPSGMVVNITDISEKKMLEAQFEQAQKMESIGTLAGGIAHDFNNFLGGLFGYMDLARKHSKDPKVTKYLAKAVESVDRAKGLTRQLLTFSKGGAPVKKIDSLVPFIEETTRFALSGANVGCRFEIPDDLWTCEYDKSQIGQVIDNIVINAVHAMPLGGNIIVSAQNMDLTENYTLALAPGKYVNISISDTGTGIPEEHIKRIFDPFFSTKQTGSGLGLATAYSIVKRHEGIIDVISKPGEGSVFHIYLPSTGKTVSQVEDRTEQTYRSSGRMLVMDDEKAIRDMLSDMLEIIGFTCVAASDGEQAVKAFKTAMEQGKPFEAVILDLTIPGGMGGKQAVQQIRRLDEKVPVIVASGYSEDEAIADPQAFGFTASVEKPFIMKQIEDVLRSAL